MAWWNPGGIFDYRDENSPTIDTTKNTAPYEGSHAWTTRGMGSFGSSVLSNYMQLQSDLDQSDALDYQASRYTFKAERSKLAAEAATIQTKLNNTILQEQFNETQALQATQFAMQGRSGATIANIIRQDQENLNWDKEFMELSGIIEKSNLELDATGYRIDAAESKKAAATGRTSAYKKQAIGLLGAGLKAATIV